MASHWTDERTAELKRLVAARLSASEIAKEMGGGLTRNSIIGKCYRLGLELGGADKVLRAKNPRGPRPLKPSKAARLFVGSWGACPEIIPGHVPPTPVADLVPLNIPLADIGAFQCRWITSQQPVLFCGHPTVVGSWCPTHRAIVFTPRTEKRATRKMEMAA
jgi:GcrA cell cycle regulator